MARKREISQHEEFEDVPIDPDEPVYTASVVCRLLDIPIWVLKQLDREGVVSPQRKKAGQTRLYSKREFKHVKHCWYYMREHRVKIDGLKVILQMENGTFEGPKE